MRRADQVVLPLSSLIHGSLLTDLFVISGQSTRSSTRTTTGARLAAAIAAEKLDEFGNPVQLYHQRPTEPRNSRTVAKRKRMAIDDADTDPDDDNFAASSADDESGNDDRDNTDIVEISNEEV
jgi:hypothetical protein